MLWGHTLTQIYPPQTMPCSRICLALLSCPNPNLFSYIFSVSYILGALLTTWRQLDENELIQLLVNIYQCYDTAQGYGRIYSLLKPAVLGNVPGLRETRMAMSFWVAWYRQQCAPKCGSTVISRCISQLLIKICHCLGCKRGLFSGDTWGGHSEFTFLACCHFSVL